MELTHTQFAYFFDTPIESPTELFIRIRQKYESLLDEEPIINPLPNEAAAEIPSVIMRSKKQDVSANISRARIDFFFNHVIPGGITWNRAFSMFSELYENISGYSSVSRIGVIQTYFEETENPASDLASKMLSVTLDPGADEVSVRYNEPLMDGVRYNRVRQFQSTALQKSDQAILGVSETIDINTDPRLTSLSNENVEKVLSLCRSEIQKHEAICE